MEGDDIVLAQLSGSCHLDLVDIFWGSGHTKLLTIAISLADIWKKWRIQDFPEGDALTPKSAIIFLFFAENCMKMKEFGSHGGARPWRPL